MATGSSSLPTAGAGAAENPGPTPPLAVSDEPRELDDIKIKYHPNSNLREKIYRFEDYTRERPQAEAPEPDPWKPFKSRDDFELADIILQTGMKEKQVKTLLDIISRLRRDESDLSFQKYEDVKSGWEQASTLYPSVSLPSVIIIQLLYRSVYLQFEKKTISVPYHKETRQFDVFVRDLEQLIILQLQDPALAQLFQWDARQMFKWDGKDWVQFYEAEPIQGEILWKAQVVL